MSATIVLTLGLGVGLVTLVFTFLNAWAWRPLPYPDAERLAWLVVERERHLASDLPADLLREVAGLRSFDVAAGYTTRDANLATGDTPQRVRRVAFDGPLLPMLGARAALGTLPDIGVPGRAGAPAVILSHAFWRAALGGDSTVVGSTVRLDDVPVAVAGVLDEDFAFDRGDVFVPSGALATPPEGLAVVALRTRDATPAQARAEVAAFGAGLHEAGRIDGALGLREDPPDRRSVPAGTVGMFTFVTVLGLLMATGSVTNLLLARGLARESDWAVRLAIGASRGRLARESLAETLVLAACAGAVGLFVASWGADLLLALARWNLPSWIRVGVDLRVFGFVLAVAAVVAVVAGALPALYAARADVQRLIQAGVGATSAPRHSRLARGIVGLQVALAIGVCAATVLLVRSTVALLRLDPGYAAERVLTARIGVDRQNYPTAADEHRLAAALAERISHIGAVQAVATVASFTGFAPDSVPSGRSGGAVAVQAESASGEVVPARRARVLVVDTGYAHVLQLPLRGGRFFGPDDRADAPLVAVVSEALANEIWPGRSAIGMRVRTDSVGAPWATVVGVLADRNELLGGRAGLRVEPWRGFYLPAAQLAGGMPHVLARTAGDPMMLAPIVRAELRALDADQALTRVATLAYTQEVHLSMVQLVGGIFFVVAALSVILALVGLYGTAAFTAERRTREIGIRIALGATPRHVLATLLGSMRLVACGGVAGGVLIGVALGGSMRRFLLSVEPTDPVALLGVACGFGALLVLATWGAGRRAIRLGTARALRAE